MADTTKTASDMTEQMNLQFVNSLRLALSAILTVPSFIYKSVELERVLF